MITRNAYEVRTLIRIGYHPKKLIKKFFFYFIRVFGIVTALGLGVFFIFKFFLDAMFESGGIYIDTSMTTGSIIAIVTAFALFAFASFMSARKGIFNEY